MKITLHPAPTQIPTFGELAIGEWFIFADTYRNDPVGARLYRKTSTSRASEMKTAHECVVEVLDVKVFRVEIMAVTAAVIGAF